MHILRQVTLKCSSIRLALKLVPCDHLDDRDAAHAAATTLAEAFKGDGGGELNRADLRHLPWCKRQRIQFCSI